MLFAYIIQEITWINLNHNSSTALERSIINNCEGLNRFNMTRSSPSVSAVVHNI